jgi:uncharacterized protein
MTTRPSGTAPGHRPGHWLRLVLASSDEAKDALTVPRFTDPPLGGSSVNTVHSSSRLLLPVMDAS